MNQSKTSSLLVIIDSLTHDSYHYNYILNYFYKKIKDLDFNLNKIFFITYLDQQDIHKQLDSLSENLVFVASSSIQHDNLIEKLSAKFPNFNFIKSDHFYLNVFNVLNRITNGDDLLKSYILADQLVYDFGSVLCDVSDECLSFLSKKVDHTVLNQKIKHSISVIEKCLRDRSNNNQTCISFNGGKDCCVVLYLFYACALRMGYKFPINVLIINIKHSFPEMDFFIDSQIKSFYKQSLNYIIFDDTSKSLKECLCDLKESNKEIDSILMGTRRTDSSYFKTMQEFAPTDKDWPEYVRVNPILDWSYSEIWYFIRLLKIPYCSLYDNGYTSLDNSTNTVRNKGLLKPDGTYLPAYMLENGELERESRIKYAKL